MKYLALAAIATAVNAATSFNLISTKAGSIYDGKHVLNRPEHIELGDGDGNGISFVLNDDGSLVDAPAQNTSTLKVTLPSLDRTTSRDSPLATAVRTEAVLTLWYSTRQSVTTSTQEPQVPVLLEGVERGRRPVPEHTNQEGRQPPHVFAVGGDEGKDLVVNFQDDGTSLVDEDGRGVKHDSNTGEVGSVAPFGREPATPGFGINGDHLVFEGRDDWKACPSGPDKFSLSDGDCEGGTNIVLQVVWKANLLKSDDKKDKRH
ncbi:hypothetical protein CJJ09_005220 [Candidozyma auris]|nr:hypothetical protein CJJ09_005220 [[Candida] auris]